MLIRSASGLRGIVKDDFSPEMIDRYIASFLITQNNSNTKHCVIGRDGRQSGKKISQWVIDSLTKYGVNVDNCGLATTPTMQLMTEKEQYDGGIVITASHNPSEYNGLKFLQKDGTFLSPDQCNMLFASVDSQEKNDPWRKAGRVSMYNSANEEHINKVLGAQCIESDNINSKKFKVVIDAVNGAGSDILPQLLKSLGCEVIMINCDGDGNFTRVAEPLAENLKDLENKVRETNADIGFATDPDGDRLSIVSNEGKAIGEEYTLVLACKNFLKYPAVPPDKYIVTNWSTSQMIDSLPHSGVERTKVGEAHIVEKMKVFDSSFGGEGNGGVILKEVHFGRDSLVAAAMVLNLLSKENKSINDIIGEIPKYIFIKDRINIYNSIDFDDLAKRFKCDGINSGINRDDGLCYFNRKGKVWIHIRKSNTEPIIRIFAEATTEVEANMLIKNIKDYLDGFGKKWMERK